MFRYGHIDEIDVVYDTIENSVSFEISMEAGANAFR